MVMECPHDHPPMLVLDSHYKRAGGEPTWEIRRRFSLHVRQLAKEGWTRTVAYYAGSTKPASFRIQDLPDL